MSNQSTKPKIMVENVSCIVPQTEALGGIFLGNIYGAQNAEILKQYGIRAVLTTSIETPISYEASAIPFHMKIDAHDKSDFSILEYMSDCLDFIHKFRQITNVFIHCYAGVSRSGTIVIAYLMKFWSWSLKSALAFVQSKRVVVKPNEGFMEQLQKYELSLRPASLYNRNFIRSYPTLQTLSMNERGNVSPTPISNTASRIAYKRHSEIPIPRILSGIGPKKQSKKWESQYGSMEPHSTKRISNTQVKLTNQMSSRALIRPKDLPGYKNL